MKNIDNYKEIVEKLGREELKDVYGIESNDINTVIGIGKHVLIKHYGVTKSDKQIRRCDNMECGYCEFNNKSCVTSMNKWLEEEIEVNAYSRIEELLKEMKIKTIDLRGMLQNDELISFKYLNKSMSVEEFDKLNIYILTTNDILLNLYKGNLYSSVAKEKELKIYKLLYHALLDYMGI